MNAITPILAGVIQAQCVQHVPTLLTRGRKHRPDDSAVGRAGPNTEAAGDFLLHLFGPHALLRQVDG